MTTAPLIELVEIDTLTPHADNPRQGDIGAIMESIAMNRWWGSVIASRRADGTLVILAGEHRWRALRALQDEGYTRPDGTTIPYSQLNHVPPIGQVPAFVMEGLTLDGERKVLLADNRANDLSSYDNDQLASLLSELAANDNLAGTLYDGDDLDALLHVLNAPDLDVLATHIGPMTDEDGYRRVTFLLTPELADEVAAALRETGLSGAEADQALVTAWLSS